MRQLAIAFIFFLLTPLALAKPNVQPLDGVAAIVNDSVITQSQLDQQIQMVSANLKSEKIAIPPANVLHSQVLQHLIDQTLQLQMAKRLGLQVNNMDINQALARIAHQNRISMAQLRQKMEGEGVNYREFRGEIGKEILIEKTHQRAIASRIRITPQEVDQILKSMPKDKPISEYHLFDILIALPDAPSSQQVQAAKQRAEQVMSQLKKGTDFQQLAIAKSNGQQALKGGDLGWRKLEALPEVFAKRVVNMKQGSIAGPIRAGNGFHVIKLVAVKTENNQHFVEETQVRHILLKTTAVVTTQDVKAELTKFRQEMLNKQATFEQLAKKYSEDPGSAAKGGELAWVKPGLLTPRFQIAMNQLKVGAISQPIQTPFGWHLIQVLGRRKVDDTKSYKREQVRNMIFQRKLEEGIDNWIQELRGDAYIKTMAQH